RIVRWLPAAQPLVARRPYRELAVLADLALHANAAGVLPRHDVAADGQPRPVPSPVGPMANGPAGRSMVPSSKAGGCRWTSLNPRRTDTTPVRSSGSGARPRRRAATNAWTA